MRITLALVLLSQTVLAAFSQIDEGHATIYVIGNIYDLDSLENLPLVGISLNNKHHNFSDANGHFQLSVVASDTMRFTAAGFETTILTLADMQYSDDTIYLEILMKLKPYEMQEATIRPFVSYQQFKQALINMNTGHPVANADSIIKTAVENMNRYAKSDMDEYANFRNTMFMKDMNNNSLIFLSTEPGKGLIGGLNAIGIRLPWQKK